MAKFNKKVYSPAKMKVVNRAGGEAYVQSEKLELVSILLTSFLKDNFYEAADDRRKRLVALIEKSKDKKFIAKAAIYARTVFGMRSITHVTAAEICRVVKGEPWVKEFIQKVVFRPDDMLEIAAYYMTNYSTYLPGSMRKGFKAIFESKEKFGAYQWAKYKAGTRGLKMVDLINLVHPRPTDDINKLMKGELSPAETWEVKLSQVGKEATGEDEKLELKGQVWRDLITENKLGYFALLRNLRNISQQASEEVLDLALKQLVDPKAVNNPKNLVFPFRYRTAIQQFRGADKKDRSILRALNTAMEISLNNVPKFGGETAVVLDCSGSMGGEPIDIGSLFAGAICKSNDADLMLFSDSAYYVSYRSEDTLDTIIKTILSKVRSGGTNFHDIFDKLNKKYDRIFILSDMQGWVGYNTPKKEFNAYCKKYKAEPFIYSFDLTGYGDMQFPENKVCCIGGFSEKIFDVISMGEKDKQALIHTIEEVPV